MNDLRLYNIVLNVKIVVTYEINKESRIENIVLCMFCKFISLFNYNSTDIRKTFKSRTVNIYLFNYLLLQTNIII